MYIIGSPPPIVCHTPSSIADGPMAVKLKPVPTRVPMLNPCRTGVERRSGPELKLNRRLTARFNCESISQSSMMSPLKPSIILPFLSAMMLFEVSRTSTVKMALEEVSDSSARMPYPFGWFSPPMTEGVIPRTIMLPFCGNTSPRRKLSMYHPDMLSSTLSWVLAVWCITKRS